MELREEPIMTESLIGVALTVGVIALAAVVISLLRRKMRGDSWPINEGRSPWWM
jgi:hypothetical protein